MRNPFWLSRTEVRDLDRRAIEELGVPGVVLMENAGRGTAELLSRLNFASEPVHILCGPGNNGGDGFVMARHLQLAGIEPRVWLFAPGAEVKLSPDAQVNYQIWVRAGGLVRHIDTAESAPAPPVDEVITGRGWIVDALFGTGLTRPLDSPFVELIRALNSSGKNILAVDLPSGLDCDTGKPLGECIRARHTATFVAQKKGFLSPDTWPWLGKVHVIEIGAPKTLVDEYRALSA